MTFDSTLQTTNMTRAVFNVLSRHISSNEKVHAKGLLPVEIRSLGWW